MLELYLWFDARLEFFTELYLVLCIAYADARYLFFRYEWKADLTIEEDRHGG